MQKTVEPQTKAAPSTRVEQERTQRRRRDDLGVGRLRNLALDGEKDPNFEYRWVNDDPGRLHQLTRSDDWDVVDGSAFDANAKDKGVGSIIERVVDKRTGKRAVLIRKRKDWYLADKAKEQAHIDELEQTLKRGGAGGSEGLAAKEGAKAYVPQAGINIESGSKTYSP